MSKGYDSRLPSTVDRPSPESSGARRDEPAVTAGVGVGRYRVLERLGAGGMGVVYAALDPELGRKVALKLLRADDGGAALLREAQALARVAHPNVVTVYDVGSFQGEVYLVLELVEGSTLGEWLAARPRSVDEVLQVVGAAGRGLAAVHERDLAHQDFKPSNVLLDDKGTVRVSDFGLARVLQGPHVAGAPGAPGLPGRTTTGGTPGYMAPEQWAGGGADARADQFAFCVVLFEALTGALPFARRPLDDGPWQPPSFPSGSRVPSGVRQAVLRGLSREPSARFESMNALLAALEPRPLRSRRGVQLLLGAALVGAVAFVPAKRAVDSARCQAYARGLLGTGPQPEPSAAYAARLEHELATSCTGGGTGQPCLERMARELRSLETLIETGAIDIAAAGAVELLEPPETCRLGPAPAPGPEARLMRSRVLLSQRHDAEAESLLRSLAEETRTSPAAHTEALRLLGRVRLSRTEMELGSAKVRAARRAAALTTWSTEPTAGALVELVHTWFPEQATARGDAGGLNVTPPASATAPVTLAVKEHVFTLRREGAQAAGVTPVQGGTVFGADRLLAPLGGTWSTQRLDEYMLLPEAATAATLRYRLELPKGRWKVRHTGDWLELRPGESSPVLRLHVPVARDSRSERLVARVEGLELGAERDVTEALSLEFSLELDGLVGPVVTDTGFSATTQPGVMRWKRHTATLLPSGKVLVVGGKLGDEFLASAEELDPVSGTWSAVGALSTESALHTATLLPSGEVLVAGGLARRGGDFELNRCERYDPKTGRWSRSAPMRHARYVHTATLLPSGHVLVAGGYNLAALDTAEVYDPAADVWREVGRLPSHHESHMAQLLPTGEVLVAGGYGHGGAATSDAALYLPKTGRWRPVGPMLEARGSATATLLGSGLVLLAGGYTHVASAELFDPLRGTFTATAAMSRPRYLHTATLLPSGEVLVAGGESEPDTSMPEAELYDPATGRWRQAPALALSRTGMMATLLDGGVLLTGGDGNAAHAATSELYALPR